MKTFFWLVCLISVSGCALVHPASYEFSSREFAPDEYELHFKSSHATHMNELKRQFRKKSISLCGEDKYFRLRALREDVYFQTMEHELQGEIECRPLSS